MIKGSESPLKKKKIPQNSMQTFLHEHIRNTYLFFCNVDDTQPFVISGTAHNPPHFTLEKQPTNVIIINMSKHVR
jgi:hypothetical protein